MWWCKKQLRLEREEWESDNGIVEKLDTNHTSNAGTDAAVEAGAGAAYEAPDGNGAEVLDKGRIEGFGRGVAETRGESPAVNVEEVERMRRDDNVSPGDRTGMVSSPLAIAPEDDWRVGRSPPLVS